MKVPTGEFALRSEKGPVVRPSPHPQSCSTVDELLKLVKSIDAPLAADLFSGAGGFSFGIDDAGFKTVVGVDNDENALETFRSLFAGLALQLDLSNPAAIDEICGILTAVGITILVGGPPCQPFSRAGRATIRTLVNSGTREVYDRRRDLWQSFLEITERVRPRIMMMENVPDLALGDESRILRVLIERLESIGYGVDTRLLDAWRFGVPQYRQRLFLVAVEQGKSFDWPPESQQQTTVNNAIGDLPEIRGGWNEVGGSDGFHDYAGPRTEFQRAARRGIEPPDDARTYDHVTRAVRADDLAAFVQMDHETLYSDLPDELKRYRDDSFDDKYKRLNGDDVGRTIIAHMAKDGYGFIHPTQHRTLSIREAARLQTFPDRVRFAGSPTSALRQIGNAVPPMLARQLGEAALRSLHNAPGSGHSTRTTADTLADWYESRGPVGQPWLNAADIWRIVLGDLLLYRCDPVVVRSVWPLVEQIETPEAALENPERLGQLAALAGRPNAAAAILKRAQRFSPRPNGAAELRSIGVPEGQARLAAMASPTSDDDILFSERGVLRVVARFFGSRVDRENRRSAGRIETSRLVGAGDHERLSNLALVEIARSICLPERPRCHECPLQESCRESLASDRGVQAQIF